MPVLSADLVFFAGRYALLLFAFVVLGFAFAHWRRAARLDAQRLFEQMDIAISRLHVIEESIAEQHARLEGLLQSVESQTRITAAAASSPPQRQYETAIRLARGGSSREEIISSCGVTRHEAELLVRLHAPRVVPDESAVAAPLASDVPQAAPASRLLAVG